IAITDQKMIQSSNDLIVDFNITNNSKNNFKECKITAKIFADKIPNDNIIEEYKKKFIPFRQKSREIKDLKKNATQVQRIAFENFNYENNYTIRL
ncbi:membrane protein, partial [Vibrio parahaemolyticus]